LKLGRLWGGTVTHAYNGGLEAWVGEVSTFSVDINVFLYFGASQSLKDNLYSFCSIRVCTLMVKERSEGSKPHKLPCFHRCFLFITPSSPIFCELPVVNSARFLYKRWLSAENSRSLVDSTLHLSA